MSFSDDPRPGKAPRLLRFHPGADNGFSHPLSSEITPPAVYRERRRWLQGAVASAGLGLSAWTASSAHAALPGAVSTVAGAQTMERLTRREDATSYNNFYEFSTDKAEPARLAQRMPTAPWRVEISGLVKKPGLWHLDDLLKFAPMEERIYRLRCVEGWSMVIPWVGYSLAELVRRVEPLSGARYVEFTTQADPATMPGLKTRVLDWPYVEGLRLDEAMHPLTLLAFGMYGDVLPNQNGAPLRVVMPWKYGFKSAKSLVKIRFVEREPLTSWHRAAPQEYGFYANVNPNVDHPRWSQASERRIGEDGLFAKKRKTLMFNGYEAQVASLYAGLDLQKFF